VRAGARRKRHKILEETNHLVELVCRNNQPIVVENVFFLTSGKSMSQEGKIRRGKTMLDYYDHEQSIAA